MNYLTIIYGIITFVLTMFLHIVIWRTVSRKTHLVPLVKVFFIAPAIVLIIFVIFKESFTPVEAVAVYLFHIALSAGYIVSYPALQAQCPTLSMLLIIDRSGPEGACSDELKASFEVEHFVGPRVEDLIASDFIVKETESYRLTGKGAFLLSPFVLLRRLLGLPTGKG